MEVSLLCSCLTEPSSFFLQHQGSRLFTVTQTVSPHQSADASSLVPVPVSALKGVALGNFSRPGCELL